MATNYGDSTENKGKRVCIVGAGVCGIGCLRRFVDAGYETRCYDCRQDIGGVWSQQSSLLDMTEHPMLSEILGDPIYEGLQTNLPTAIMQYSNFPYKNANSFVYPKDVMDYMRDYIKSFNLAQFIHLNAIVQMVTFDEQSKKYAVTIFENGLETKHIFDYMVIANGHYSKPRFLPKQLNLEAWSKDMYSHSQTYRNNKPFVGKVVLVIGNASSGSDIVGQLSSVCKRVYVSDSKLPAYGSERYQNLELKLVDPEDKAAGYSLKDKHDGADVRWLSATKQLHGQGNVEFQSGYCVSDVEHIIFATGYSFSFSFLPSVDAGKMFDGSLVAFTFLRHQPSMFFIGLPYRIFPFSLSDVQSGFALQIMEMNDAELNNLVGKYKATGIDPHYELNPEKRTKLETFLIRNGNPHCVTTYLKRLAAREGIFKELKYELLKLSYPGWPVFYRRYHVKISSEDEEQWSIEEPDN